MTNPSHAAVHAQPFVVDGDGLRALHFSLDCVQSRMRLDDPDALDLAYTRTMMAFLLFVPRPRRISLIGLGGGSLVKFCHRHLPHARLQVAEINPQVLALRHHFMLPAEDDRLALHCVDGAHFVCQPQAECEVLLLDAFDPKGMPDALCGQRFLDDAMLALDVGGVMVVNLARADPRLDLIMSRLACSFDGEDALLAVDDDDGANRVVFARRGGPFRRVRPSPLAGPALRLAADFAPVLAALNRAGLPAGHPR